MTLDEVLRNEELIQEVNGLNTTLINYLKKPDIAKQLIRVVETQPAEDGSFTLPGVVSRKKQFIPALMTAYQEL